MADFGPVVVGFDGTPCGVDALSLGGWFARALGVNAIVAVVHPGPAPIGVARVDAEWVADRHRLAEEILDEARQLLVGEAETVGYRLVASLRNTPCSTGGPETVILPSSDSSRTSDSTSVSPGSTPPPGKCQPSTYECLTRNTRPLPSSTTPRTPMVKPRAKRQ